jgi:hypothetical protein
LSDKGEEKSAAGGKCASVLHGDFVGRVSAA